MFVIKDKDSSYEHDKDRQLYSELSKELRVYIYAVEKYPREIEAIQNRDREDSDEHATKARDDFYIAVLARKWRCPVVSEDRYNDIDESKKLVKPFRVYVFSYWQSNVEEDFVKPSPIVYRLLRRPFRIGYDGIFEKLIKDDEPDEKNINKIKHKQDNT